MPRIAIGHTAVAGRSTIHAMPLAICAMSPVAGEARTNPGSPAAVELIEYGFWRGVTYNLMRLNPGGTAPANFALDPPAPPGGAGSSSNTTASAIAPFVCAGRLWVPRLTGGAIRVGSPFPIASLYRQLNSRFDQYDGNACRPNGAPPDFNIKAYTPGAGGGAAWMNPRPTHQSALETVARGRLETIADLPAPPAGTTSGMYGLCGPTGEQSSFRHTLPALRSRAVATTNFPFPTGRSCTPARHFRRRPIIQAPPSPISQRPVPTIRVLLRATCRSPSLNGGCCIFHCSPVPCPLAETWARPQSLSANFS